MCVCGQPPSPPLRCNERGNANGHGQVKGDTWKRERERSYEATKLATYITTVEAEDGLAMAMATAITTMAMADLNP